MIRNANFGSSAEVYGWLSSFINLERGLGGKPGEHFMLDRMRTLAGLAGNPERRVPAVHTAGSKGKGSVTAMTSAILEAAGKRPGRYMSPHVSDWRERVSAGGVFFPETVYVDAGNELSAVYDEYRNGEFSGEATFFELFTLYFFLCARTASCGALVVETGLGGRLDATNIINPAVSVITVIEMEHTEYLGNDLPAIAGEKAGIIKAGIPLVLAGQKTDEITELFQKTAREKNAPFFPARDCFSITETKADRNGLSFFPVFGETAFTQSGDLSSPYTIPVPSAVQAENAALAIMAAQRIVPGLDAETAGKALAGCVIPARFERVRDAEIIIDGAHTPGSVKQCVTTFVSLYGSGGVLLFACAADKDVRSLADILVPYFSRCFITSPGSFRTAAPEAAFAAFGAAGSGLRAEISFEAGTEKAVTAAVRCAADKKLPLLVCGSFYLAGTARDMLLQA